MLATAQILVTAAIAAGVTFALHRLGEIPWLSVDWTRLRHWLDTTPPTDALLSIARLVGLGCGWWILASTSLNLVAGLCRAPAALRLAAPFTLPFIRNLGVRVVMGAMAVSTLGTAVPAAASTDDPLPARPLDSYPAPLAFPRPPLLTPRPQTLLPAPRPLPFPGFNLLNDSEPLLHRDGESTCLPASIPCAAAAPGEHYLIAPGDHMWNIARRVLTRSMPDPPTTRQIASYWIDLIETNRETIRSGDPDLIYPGEKLFLPEIRRL